MESVDHKITVKVLRVGESVDGRNLFCEIPADSYLRVVISIDRVAMPHRHTRALVSLIQPGDTVALRFTTDIPDEHGIRRVSMLHDIVNENCRPDPPEYLIS